MKIAITFHRQPNAFQVVREQTTMEEAVPNRNILVSKFRLPPRVMLLNRSTTLRDSATDIEKTSQKGVGARAT